MTASEKKTVSPVRELPCSCATLRRATRTASGFYDESLRAVGLSTPQFGLLQALHMLGEVPQGQFGKAVALDSTTLTRNIAPLIDRGLIAVRSGEDRRQRLLSLTSKGERELRRAVPHWERAQDRFVALLGGEDTKTLMRLLDRVTAVLGETEPATSRSRRRSRAT